MLGHFRGLNLLDIKDDEMLVIMQFCRIRDYPSIEILERNWEYLEPTRKWLPCFNVMSTWDVDVYPRL